MYEFIKFVSYMNNEFMNLYLNLCISIHMQTLFGTPWIKCFFHEFIYEFMVFSEFIYEFMIRECMNSFQISWILVVFIKEIMFEIISEKYREKYRENFRDFMDVLKGILNWIHLCGAGTRRVWQSRPFLPLKLQSHMPHYQLVCLAELQCKYPGQPPWSYHTLSSGCQVHQCRLGVSPLQAWPVQ